MVLLRKRETKIIICTFITLCTSFIIYLQMKAPMISVSKIVKDEENNSKLQIKSRFSSNYDIKLYQKTKEEKYFTEVAKETKEVSRLKDNKTFEINTKDEAKPDSITNINTSVIDNYVIISFNPAKDNGTEYEYYLQGNKNDGDNIKSEISKIYSESGIKGYNYIIDNLPNTQAGFEVNKTDQDPILYSGIQWDKDYFLHIRSIDNNDNFSDNLTYKIELPSKGIKMKYIDINNCSEISPEETIIGNANDEYNIEDYNKELQGYKLINIDGEMKGKLKKERINVKYMYAKNANIVVKYFDKITGNEIEKPEYINGYEGKEFKIVHKDIEKYKYSSGELEGKMKSGKQEINLYYDELGNVNISYIDLLTGENIIKSELITDLVKTAYNIKEKNIPGYELVKVDGNVEGKIQSEDTYVIYYYKKKANITLKYVDVDTKNILDSEIIEGYEGEKITIKPKEFEGYILNDDYNKEKIIKKQKLLKNEDSKGEKIETQDKKIEVSDKPLDDESNIIDEILKEESFEKIDEQDKEVTIEKTLQQYDIVMECGDTEYIIYYKKI